MNLRPVIVLLALLGGSRSAAAAERILLEAEQAERVNKPMAVVLASNTPPATAGAAAAAAGGYLEIPEGAGNPPALVAGEAALTFDVAADGSFFLWLRVWWEGECSNSLTVQLDDRPPFLMGEDATFRVWHWVRFPVSRLTPPFALARGRHTLTLRNREDGVRVDQIILSADKRFVPVDIETAPSAGAAGGAAP